MVWFRSWLLSPHLPDHSKNLPNTQNFYRESTKSPALQGRAEDNGTNIKLDLLSCSHQQSGLSCVKSFSCFIPSTVRAAQLLGKAKPGCLPGEGTGKVTAALKSQVTERGEEQVLSSGKNLLLSFKQQQC